MLADRHYMRSSTSPQRSVTLVLIVINVVVFVLQEIGSFRFEINFDHYLALSLPGLKSGWVWQLVTFQFLHGGLLHLLCNLLTIYFFGRSLEEVLGRREFLKLYFSSGVFGGLFQMLLALLAPQHFGGAVVGASAGAFGIVAAFAMMFPDRTLTLLLFFVIPITMHARTLLWISIALALFGIAVPNDGIAHGAHLGGIIMGVAWVRWVMLSDFSLRNMSPFHREAAPQEMVATRSEKSVSWRRAKAPAAEELPSAEFISQEVDPILDKISAHGIHSLTDRERQILEQARARMSKRG